MADRTTRPRSPGAIVPDMTDHMSALVLRLQEWMCQETPDLQRLEEHIIASLKALGNALLVSLCQLLIPHDPPALQPCPCGAPAHLQRIRPATCRTLLGPLTLHRPYYLCSVCHRGCAPLDQHLGFCAGSRSAALDEVLALLGATQDSFADAAVVLERLTLLQVAPKTVRAATEQRGCPGGGRAGAGDRPPGRPTPRRCAARTHRTALRFARRGADAPHA